jgi:CheY-like chemotaxis protein
VPEHAVILLVEDREDDVLLIRRAFKKAGLDTPLHVVADGNEAIAYLSGERQYANRAEHPLPDLILLDLKMPGLDGFEILAWIRQQPGIRGIAVVVLTSSDQIRDVNRAYALGANSFLVKPIDFENYTELSRLIHEYWMKTVKVPETFRLPPKPNGTQCRSG